MLLVCYIWYCLLWSCVGACDLSPFKNEYSIDEYLRMQLPCAVDKLQKEFSLASLLPKKARCEKELELCEKGIMLLLQTPCKNEQFLQYTMNNSKTKFFRVFYKDSHGAYVFSSSKLQDKVIADLLRLIDNRCFKID